MAEAILVTFTCRSCGHQFQHQSPDFTLKLKDIQCPECFWSPSEIR